MGIRSEQIKPLIGSVVHVGKEDLTDPRVNREILDLLEERTVLVFPELELSDEEQLELTDRLGSRVDYSSNVPGGTSAGTDIYEITLDTSINNEPEYVLSTFFWHFDGSHGHIEPPRASLLTSRGVAKKGGQTEFANTYAAYERLPDDEKAEIEGLRVRHSIISSMRPFVDSPGEEECTRWINAVFKSREAEGSGPVGSSDDFEKEHPLVWKHKSGRKSLVLGVSADRVVGMPLAEGRALLSRLQEWTVQPDFTYRHNWREGDLVICNNPGALHRVLPYDEHSGRVMHRTTVSGVELIN